MEKEKWLDVENFESSYQVSNLGRVRSIKRFVLKSNGSKYTVKGRILRLHKDKDGYLQTTFSVNAIPRTIKIHRLVGAAFIPNPDNLPEINHVKGIKHDNRSSQLAWCTHQENIDHAIRTGLIVIKKGSELNHSKLNESDIPIIRQMFKDGLSSRTIAKIYGMNKTAFLAIKNGKTWSHVK